MAIVVINEIALQFNSKLTLLLQLFFRYILFCNIYAVVFLPFKEIQFEFLVRVMFFDVLECRQNEDGKEGVKGVLAAQNAPLRPKIRGRVRGPAARGQTGLQKLRIGE